MKMVKSLLLGTAAGLVAMTGAQAADLPVKAKPVQYVKICSLYGAGFYYIPGTDTCIKIGGFVRTEVNFNAGGSLLGQDGQRLRQRAHDNNSRTGVRAPASPSMPARRPNTAPCASYTSTSDATGRRQWRQCHRPAWQPGRFWRDPYTRLWPTRRSSSSPASPLVRPGRSSTSTASAYSNQTNFWGSDPGRRRHRSVRLHRAARQRPVGVDRGGKR